MKDLALVESRTLRDEHINQVEVLEKIKAVEYMTNDMIVSVDQAANYFEVGLKAITSIIDRHNDELKQDGLRVLRGKELQEFKSKLQDEVYLKRVSAFRIIPRRALLRIGMLLTESEVAKQIRDYLLNSEQNQTKLTPEDALKTFRVVKKVLDEVCATSEAKLETTKYIFGKAGLEIPVTVNDIQNVSNTKLYLNTEFFKNIMKKKNWGHSELAKYVGTTRNHVWRLMSQNSAVGKELQKKLKKAFPQYQNMLFVEEEI